MTTWTRHPHLYFTAEQIPTIRAKTTHARFKGDWENLLAQAEEDLKTPLIRQEDKDRRIEYGAKRAARCAFVGLISGDRRFTDYGLAYLAALIKEPDWTFYAPGKWDMPFGQSTCHLAADLGFAYDLLAGEMPEAEKRTLVSSCHTRLVEVFLDDCKRPREHYLFGARTTNIAAAVASGAGRLLVALDGDGVDYSREIEIARAHSLRFIEWADDAGGATEINGYWMYGMGSTLRFLAALRANGFPKIFRQRSCKLQRTAYPLLCFSINGKNVANFGDSVYGPVTGWGRADTLLLAAEFRDRHLQWFADQTTDGGEIALIFGDPDLPAVPPDDLPTCVAYHGCGVGVMRSSMTDPNALFLGLKAGRARGTVYDDPHCQFDLNAVVLDAFGVNLLADPGYLHHDWPSGSHLRPDHISNSTPPHNTVLVDGRGQLYEHNPIAHFQNLSPSDDVDYLVSRVEQGYGPNVKRCDRHTYMIAHQFYVIVDEVETAEPSAVTWNFHGAKEASLEAGAAGRIANGDAELLLQPFGGAPMACRRADDHVLPRLQWDTTGQVTRTTTGWLLLIRRKGQEFPKVTAEFRDGQVLVTRGTRRWTLPVVSRRANWRSDMMLPFSGKAQPDVSLK
jgi:hypothetical protein